MDILICNKCFAPIHRGKQPYNIAQCSHIFCESCLQQAEKQCLQCGFVDPLFVSLKEPLVDTVTPFFTPIADTLELLLKVDTFRSNQMKITMQRFYDIDRKYEMLKKQYWTLQRDMKILMQKYVNLKSEKEKLDKKLQFSDIQSTPPHASTNVMKTPLDSGISVHSSSARYTSESMKFRKIGDIMSVQSTSVDSRKRYRTSDGFRIPRAPPRSISSLNMLNCNFT